jgi:predicted pyridoxine 5'-phosphate oxidase superfamily flavin-nucleotide-binding protein
MPYGFLDTLSTAGVRAAQAANGSLELWQGLSGHRAFDRFAAAEGAFIQAGDSFYMATVSELGWRYIQHRGGPVGFLKVLDETTLGFADFRSNRQYISLGNVGSDDRVALFLMDYPNRQRLKILAPRQRCLQHAGRPCHIPARGASRHSQRVTRLQFFPLSQPRRGSRPALHRIRHLRKM